MANGQQLKAKLIMKKVFVFSFLFSLFLNPAWAGSDYEFQSYTSSEGLSTNWGLMKILQDKFGYLWVATEREGLNRFDGYNFKVFRHDPQDSSSLRSKNISNIFIDSRDRLWVLTVIDSSGCLSLYHPQNENFSHFILKKTVSTFIPMSICELDNGQFWLGTLEGLLCFDTIKKQFIEPQNNLLFSETKNDYISDLIKDSAGTFWVGTLKNGAVKFDPQSNSVTRFTHIPGNKNSLVSNDVRRIYQDKDGVIFVGTIYSTLHMFDPVLNAMIRLPLNYGKYTSLRPPLSTGPHYGSDGDVMVVKHTRDGNFWLGTINGGIKVYNSDLKEYQSYRTEFSNNRSLSSDLVWNIYQDKMDNIWLGTLNRGFVRATPSRSLFKATGNGLAALDKFKINRVRSIFQSSDGCLWIGNTDGFLIRYDPLKNESRTFSYDINTQNSNKTIHSFDLDAFYEDKDGNIWIGTFAGIEIYNPKTGTFSKARFEIKGVVSESWYDTEAIIEDKDGKHLWIATWTNGLLKYNMKTLHVEKFLTGSHPALLSNNIWKLYRRQNGDIVAGTDNGLVIIDGSTEQFKNYLEGVSVNAIFEDADSLLWLASIQGLYKLNTVTETAKKYTEDDGLPNKMIGGILQDDKGFLWISSGRGLSKFDPEKETFLNYDENDGVLRDLSETGNAYCKTDDGLMLFGGFDGITIFNPEHIQSSSYPPKVNITSLEIYNSEQDSSYLAHTPIREKSNEFVLKHSQNDITFNYVGIHYSNPSKNKYKYKLEPYDQNWQETGTLRFARYTNIDPGKYIFKVKAANSDGIWSDDFASVEIEILPPLWQTAWAYIFYFLSFAVIIYSIRRFELNRRREKENKRLMQAENKRKSEELEEARQLQLSMLPKELPQLPHLDIAVYMQTATEVGGDYYDFHVGLDGTLTVVIGDATGHGMKAGTMVTTAKSLFNTHADNPDILFSFQEFSRCIRKMNFGRVSMCLTMLKLADHTLQISTAGMPPSYIYRAKSKDIEEYQFEAMPLGAMDKFPYQVKETQLNPGDTVLMLSDGLPELENKTGEMFGYSRIKNGFKSIAEKSPDDIISYLKNEGASWADNGDPDDDVTFVVIKVK